MNFLLNNAYSLLLGVVLPISTVTILAIGCGDNRQPVRKRKQPVVQPQQVVVQTNKQPVVDQSANAPRSRNELDITISKRSSSKSSKASSKKRRSTMRRKKMDKRELLPKRSQSKLTKQGKLKDTSSQLWNAREELDKAVSAQEPKVKYKLFTPVGTSKSSSIAVELGDMSPLPNVAPAKDLKCIVNKQRASLKETQSSKMALKNRDQYAPVYAAEPTTIRTEPHGLLFTTNGGIQQITVHNQDKNGQRHAVKVKCSDNGLYRVNPVYAFVEPGKSLALNVFRNGSASSALRTDKLVLVTAKVSNKTIDPMSAFNDPSVDQQKMVIPLLVSTGDKSSSDRCVGL